MNAAPCPPLDYFLMHTVIMLNCNGFFYAMFMSEPASGFGAEELCVRVCCCDTVDRLSLFVFFLLKPEAGSSAEANISSVILLNEESSMELFVVYLLISFKETLSACLRLSQRSLCVFGDLVMSRRELSRSCNSTLIGRFTERPPSVPNEGFSSQSHSANPALEMGQLCLLNTAGRRV